jgi:uncharacterized membrane protein YqjE
LPTLCARGTAMYFPPSSPFNGEIMFLTIALVLLVLWACGFFLFPVIGGLIHILLIIAVIAIIWHFIKGRPSTGV